MTGAVRGVPRRLVSPRLLPLLLLLLPAGLAAAGPPRPAAPPAPAARQPFRCLDYRAEQMIFKAKTRICAKKASPGELDDWLPAGDPKEPKVPAPSPGATLLRLDVFADLSGRQSEERTYFEPETGRALQRTKVKLGSDPYRKSYRFGDGALEWTRSAPKSREESERAEPVWSKIENFSAAYPGGGQCRVYSEPILLLYLVAAHDWDQQRSLDFCMFAGKKWSRVEATFAGTRPFAATYLENGHQRQVTETRVVVLKASDASDAKGEDPFELLGLRGDIEIYLDPQSGLPLAIQGEMPWLGQVTVRLEKAETPD